TCIQLNLTQRRARDGKDNGVVRLTNSLRAVLKGELNGAPGVLASPDQTHPKLDQFVVPPLGGRAGRRSIPWRQTIPPKGGTTNCAFHSFRASRCGSRLMPNWS